MLWNFKKLYWYLVVSLFLLGVSACTVQFGLPTANAPTPLVASIPTPNQDFSAQLMVAIIQHDYSKMQQMMGNQFTLAGWQSEGSELPAPVAILKVRDTYFTQNSAAAFNPNKDLTLLLGGQDPLTLWGPAVKATEAIYTTGLGASGKDEAILIIAQKPDGARYWFGMLVALGGFVNPAAASPTATALVTPTATVTTVVALPSATATTVVAAPTATTVVAPPAATATPIPQTSEPQRIQFVAGATSATLPGTLHGAEQKQYLIRALAGQTMTIKTTSTDGALLLAVQGVKDGVLYKDFTDNFATDAGSWTGALPITQDYLLILKAGVATTDQLTYAMAVAVTAPVPAPAVTPQRIQFAPGAISATVSGKVQFPNRNEYVLRANAGQQMTVEIASPGNLANFAITGLSDGQPYKRLENEDRTWAGPLPTTQDYVISVATAGANINYKLKVTVVTSDPPATTPVRIKFAAGAISSSLAGHVVAGGIDSYILGASAGQTMVVEIVSLSNDVLLSITGVQDGVPYKRSADGAATWTGVLSRNQDYLIKAVSVGGETDYTLNVKIQ